MPKRFMQQRWAIVWERATGREVARFEGHQRGTVLSLDYSPDGTHIVTSGRDGSVRVWDAETGVQLYELPERVEPVSRLRPPRRPVEHVSYGSEPLKRNHRLS